MEAAAEDDAGVSVPVDEVAEVMGGPEEEERKLHGKKMDSVVIKGTRG